MAKLRNSIVSVLDIGTTKVVCFIAEIDSLGNMRVIGIGHQVSQGIRSGTITDIKQAEDSIRAAVGAAEQMANVTVDKVFVNLSGSKINSFVIQAEMHVSGQEINQRDVQRIIEQGCEEYREDNNEIIHCVAVDYAIDGTSGIHDPVGMYGDVLGARLHIVTMASSSVYNLANCLARCHLDIEDYIISSYASALACLDNDEKELGATLIDFGGGNTSVSVFKSGKLIYTGSVPLGGMHITNDIAVGLSTNIASAERIKTLNGHVLTAARDEQEIIDIPQIGEDGDSETAHIQKASLVGVIKPRIEEILELLKEKLDTEAYAQVGGVIKITGGASQLSGLKELTGSVLERPARIGIPKAVEGMAESTRGAAFSTSVGMLLYANDQRQKKNYNYSNSSYILRNPIAIFFRWFKENF